MSSKDLINIAEEFENTHKSLKSISQKVEGARDVKDLILSINEVYKKSKKEDLMDLMKRLTTIKRKLDKRLNRHLA